MAIEDRNSDVIANILSLPRVSNQPYREGNLRSASGYVANAADDSATSVYRICRVPSNARILGVKLTTGDASTAGNINVGVYETEENGGAAVDADLLATAFDLTNGPYVQAEISDLTQYTAAERAQPLWQVLGLAKDPHKEYDVAATVSTNFNGAAVGQLYDVFYVV